MDAKNAYQLLAAGSQDLLRFGVKKEFGWRLLVAITKTKPSFEFEEATHLWVKSNIWFPHSIVLLYRHSDRNENVSKSNSAIESFCGKVAA